MILPYLREVQNRVGLIVAVLMQSPRLKIKLKNGAILNLGYRKNNVYFENFLTRFYILRFILGIITFSASFSIEGESIIKFSFDMKNKFIINLKNLQREDYNLLELLFMGIMYGADFVTEKKGGVKDYRKKTILITQKGKKKVVETYNGTKFYLDSIHVGNSIIDTFVKDIHMINPHDDWNGKIVLDVGAECGDTALYYAKMGATVFSFEPSPSNYQDMLRNLELNPDISKKVNPINAGIGEDKLLTFYESSIPGIAAGTSYLKKYYDEKNLKLFQVQGYSLESIIKKFNIKHVDLLKMDCKGCEIFINENVLTKIDKVKIEPSLWGTGIKWKDFLRIFEKAGFECALYQVEPSANTSFKNGHTFYGRRLKRN